MPLHQLSHSYAKFSHSDAHGPVYNHTCTHVTNDMHANEQTLLQQALLQQDKTNINRVQNQTSIDHAHAKVKRP